MDSELKSETTKPVIDYREAEVKRRLLERWQRVKIEREARVTKALEAWARVQADRKCHRILPDGWSGPAKRQKPESFEKLSMEDLDRMLRAKQIDKVELDEIRQWQIVQSALAKIAQGVHHNRRALGTLRRWTIHRYLKGGAPEQFIIFLVPAKMGRERGAIPDALLEMGMTQLTAIEFMDKRLRKAVAERL